MQKKKKKKPIIKVILIVIMLATMLALSSHVINENRKLSIIEKALKDSGSFIENILYTPVKFIKDKVEFLTEADKVYDDYLKLKKKVKKIDSYSAQIDELKKENQDLKNALDLNATLSEYTYVNATVISRNVGYWYNTLTINKGSKNKVKLGDAVITNHGLIGKVSSVSKYSSTVKLLTSDEILNKICIKVIHDGQSFYGLLAGYDVDRNIYKIEGITESSNVSDNDLVTTTGLTENFPSGILIGTVSRIVLDEYGLNSVVEVTPSVNFNDINIVTVLNREA